MDPGNNRKSITKIRKQELTLSVDERQKLAQFFLLLREIDNRINKNIKTERRRVIKVLNMIRTKKGSCSALPNAHHFLYILMPYRFSKNN